MEQDFGLQTIQLWHSR